MSIPTSAQNKKVIASRKIDGHSARIGGGAKSDGAQNVLAIDQINTGNAGISNIMDTHERRYFCGLIPPNSTDYAYAEIGDIYDEFTADSGESSQPHDFTRWCYTAAGWERMTKRTHVRYLQAYGDGTTRYDVTSQGSDVFRYTWDGTGTDPNFETNLLKVGDKVTISNGFATVNEGNFAVVALSDDYIEIVNSSGTAEADVVCGTAITAYATLDAVIDDVVLASYTAGTTATLFTAVGCAGRVITVKSISTGIITVDANASETIDGSATVLLNEANAFVTLMSDGANWRIIGTNESSISVSVSNTVVTKTSDHTTTYADDTVIANKGSAITITLGTAACVSGKIQRIKNKGTGACTVATEASETIDGAATFSLAEQYDEITVQSDGTNWYVVEKNVGDHLSQDISTLGTLTVGGNTTLDGTLSATDGATTLKSLTVNTTLAVTTTSAFSGNAAFYGTLSVTDAATTLKSLTVNETLAVTTTSTFGGNAAFYGTVSATDGATTLKSLTINETLGVTTNAVVSGNLTSYGNLSVTAGGGTIAALAVSGLVSVGNTLTVGGNTAFYGTLGVTDGATTLKSLTVNETLAVTTTSAFSGNASFYGTLGVTCAATTLKSLTVNETLAVTTTSTFSGNAAFYGTLSVTDAATTLKSLTVNETLAVTTNATISGDITGYGTLSLTAGGATIAALSTSNIMSVGTSLTVGTTITPGGNIVSNSNSGVSLGSHTAQKIGFFGITTTQAAHLADPGTSGSALSTWAAAINKRLEGIGINKTS